MKNNEVVKDFFENRQSKTKHLFTEKNIIYSYGYHFPLCIKLKDGIAINQNSYSNTTARHKGLIVRYLGYPNFKVLEKVTAKDILILPTDKLKKIIELNLNSITEILEREI